MKIKILLLLIIALLTIQCSSDGITDSNSDEFMIGDWIVTDVSMQGKVTATEQNSEYWNWVFYPYPIPVISSKLETENYEVNFSKAPKQVTSIGSLNTSYVLDFYDYNDVISKVVEINNIDFFKYGNWQLNNSVVTVISNNQNEKYYIDKVSDSEIRVLKLLRDNLFLNSFEGEVKCVANLDMWVTLERK